LRGLSQLQSPGWMNRRPAFQQRKCRNPGDVKLGRRAQGVHPTGPIPTVQMLLRLRRETGSTRARGIEPAEGRAQHQLQKLNFKESAQMHKSDEDKLAQCAETIKTHRGDTTPADAFILEPGPALYCLRPMPHSRRRAGRVGVIQVRYRQVSG
jgi:hypothetical protein